MLKYFDPKLYRKFLILAVLLGGLFVTFSFNRAAATAYPCCGPRWDACDNTYYDCVAFCDYHYQQNPARHAQCVGICQEDLSDCYADAAPCNPDC